MGPCLIQPVINYRKWEQKRSASRSTGSSRRSLGRAVHEISRETAQQVSGTVERYGSTRAGFSLVEQSVRGFKSYCSCSHKPWHQINSLPKCHTHYPPPSYTIAHHQPYMVDSKSHLNSNKRKYSILERKEREDWRVFLLNLSNVRWYKL